MNEIIWEEIVGQRSGDACKSSSSLLWSSEGCFILFNIPSNFLDAEFRKSTNICTNS